jgi:predicted nucleic acid-binding Zn ribbon protein
MPIYEYECQECGRVTEIFGPLDMAEEFYKRCYCIFPVPITRHKRIISRSNFHLKGPGWSKDGYEDRPWGKKEYHKAVQEDGYVPGSYVKTGKAAFKKK